jgi:hypothetical protein
LIQSVSDPSDLTSLTNNLSHIHRYSSEAGLNLNMSKCFECLFSMSRSNVPSEPTVLSCTPLSRVTSVKYLGVTIDSSLHWSSHIQSRLSSLRRLSYQIRKLRQFRVRPAVIELFLSQCVFPLVLYCSPVIFPGLLKKDFKLLRQGLSVISRVSSIPLDDLISRLCRIHIDSCEKFAHRILGDPSHPLYDPLSSCHSFHSTRSKFRLIPSRINVYRNSPVPYLARVLTNKSQLFNDLVLSFQS